MKSLVVPHAETGLMVAVSPWDGNFTMDGRMLHSCPICGLGVVTTPFDQASASAHASCIEKTEKQ